LDILQVVLRNHKIKYLLLTGSTPVDVRQTLVDEFTEDESIPIFLLSTKAGGEQLWSLSFCSWSHAPCAGMGINLTAASVVIMFDQDFNPHNDKQAQDRAYRIGQKRDVDVVKLISRGTIEEDMLKLGVTKLALDEAVAGDVDGDGEAKGESKAEKEVKTSLMRVLRRKLEDKEEGKGKGTEQEAAEDAVADVEGGKSAKKDVPPSSVKDSAKKEPEAKRSGRLKSERSRA
jgi:SWI/SNF-related matrix-associated actin-dependent regulator of chromatin subfamily A containing DEAD/H box 1